MDHVPRVEFEKIQHMVERSSETYWLDSAMEMNMGEYLLH